MKANDERRDSPDAGKYFLGGGVLAAFAASLCCVGPLLAAALGLGVFTAAGFFHTLRPLFLTLAVFLIAAAWVWDWRKRRRAAFAPELAGESCERGCWKNSRVSLLFITAFALLLGLFPYLLELAVN